MAKYDCVWDLTHPVVKAYHRQQMAGYVGAERRRAYTMADHEAVVKAAWDSTLTGADYTLRRTALGLTMMFVGLLRASELAYNQAALSGRHKVGDVEVQAEYVVYRVGFTKTRRSGQGRVVAYPRSTAQALLPFHVDVGAQWHRLGMGTSRTEDILRCGGASGPLTVEGLRRRFFHLCELARVDTAHLNLHSLRIGGATLLAEHGASVERIATLGDWESLQSVKTYVRGAVRPRAQFMGDVLGQALNGGCRISGGR